MPNPFLPSFAQVREAALRSGVLNPNGRKSSPEQDITGHDLPAPVDPQEEGRQGFLPYRGVEMHGVPSPAPLEEDAEGYGGGTVHVHYDDSGDDVHVLPVRIVSGEESETIAAWRATSSVAPVAGDRPPVQILPRNRKRTKAKVQNIAAADGAWIGPDTSVSAMNGWFIAPGQSVELSSTEAVYALSATANPVPLTALVEFTQEA